MRLVIGIGSPYRSDDAAGLRTADILSGMSLAGAVVRKEERDGFAMMDAWEGAGEVILIDAMSSGLPPGTVRKFYGEQIRSDRRALRCSIHGFGLAEAVELSELMGTLPRRLSIFGIEGTSFETGTRISAAVLKGCGEAANEIAGILRIPAGNPV